jgi:thiamine transport system substrate-binding protein
VLKQTHPDTKLFWAKLSQQWLTLTPGWTEAYSLFLDKKAPLVWSYRTSLAYHRHENQGQLYTFVELKEGAPIQIEGAAITISPDQKQKLGAARQFLEILISEKIQEALPKRQWMMPVRQNVQLSKEFDGLAPKNEIISIRPTATALQESLASWKQAIRQ